MDMDEKVLSLKRQVPNFKEFTAKGCIDHCTNVLEISHSMLAALLNVSERTLVKWRDQPILENQAQGKIDRLKTIYKIITLASSEGINGRVILNLLNESIPNDEEGRSLLYYVVDDPNHYLVRTVASQVIESFK